MFSTARPSPLRLIHFVCTALGGLLMGVGALLTWATVSLGPQIEGVETKGIDTTEGKIVLGLAVLVLLSIPALRMAPSIGARRALVASVLLASLAAGALALFDVLAKDDRLGLPALDEKQREVAEASGLPLPGIKQLQALTFVELKPGIYVALVGAVLGLAGGALGLAWIRRGELLPASDAPGDEPVPGST
jgi:MFS family permease